MDRDSTISEHTKVPISLVIALIASITAVTIWAVRIEVKTDTKVNREDYIQDMADLKNDVRAIKRHFKIDQ